MSFETLDVVFGLIGVYVFLSLICTTIKELIAQFFEKRATTLLTGLRRLLDGEFDPERSSRLLAWIGGLEGKVDLAELDDESLTKKLYGHPLVQGLSEGPGKPSYIPPKTFATALLDLVDPVSGEESRTIESVRDSVKELPEDLPLRSVLQSLLRDADGDLDRFRDDLKTWYDDSMDRVSSWYKKHTQRAVLVIAAVITVAANADTLQMVEQLSANDALREAAVQQARTIAENAPPTMGDSLDALATQTRTYVEAYGTLGIPLGWESAALPTGLWGWLNKGLGLLLTTFAVSLGAPFWFDVLKTISTIRSAGRSPREK